MFYPVLLEQWLLVISAYAATFLVQKCDYLLFVKQHRNNWTRKKVHSKTVVCYLNLRDTLLMLGHRFWTCENRSVLTYKVSISYRGWNPDIELLVSKHRMLSSLGQHVMYLGGRRCQWQTWTAVNNYNIFSNYCFSSTFCLLQNTCFRTISVRYYVAIRR